jgi:microsomal epoxide hydrolase
VTDSGGITLDEVRSVLSYWAEEFDWEAQEMMLNELPHFRAGAVGRRVHFVHLRSDEPSAPALLLLHGWPGSFLEFIEVIALLRDYHLVVPSLPGYGFSDAPALAGMTDLHMADQMASLMTDLGYHRFAVQGGDWGAGVATWLALRHAGPVEGIHLNYVPVWRPSGHSPAHAGVRPQRLARRTGRVGHREVSRVGRADERYPD